MSLTRQLSLIVMPPLFFMVLHVVYGAAVGWGSVTSMVFVTLLMAGTSVGLSYLLARPLIRKTSAIVKVSNSLIDETDASKTISNSYDVDAVLKTLKFVKSNQSDMTETLNESGAKLDALNRSQATIEFDLNGIILTANDNFLKALGYTVDEVRNQHHSMFVEREFAASTEYRSFWDSLGRGEFQAGEFKRIDKSGKDIWIQASYNPIFDLHGKAIKVVKYASDVTEEKMKSADYEGQIEAIGKAQAVIEFDLTGKILDANENFLSTLGYTLDEIKNQHHSMFVTAEYSASAEYRSFWDSLKRGEYQSGEFKRVAKGGRDVWIQASYNPILDLNGAPFKVVKFASDVTEQKMINANYEGQIEAIAKAQAVIEFDLTGKIVDANENFLGALGYSINEIKGQHHSMFVEKEYSGSVEYRSFWESLGRGEYQSGEFKRIGKNGQDIWIQASYNPILDLNGKPFKVVKFASDVTEVHNQRRRHEEEQKAQAAVQDLVVTSLADGLQKLADGDLSNKIEVEFSSEYEQLRSDFNQAVGKLQDTISVIVSTADGIRQGSGEISTATDDLSKRTENQAATLEQTAAALDQITATVKQSSENAVEANDVAGRAQQEAQESGEVVRDTVVAMGEIEKSAHQISQIIGVIDDIAFQTNLLALNAGVEAARAGDAGRGFAVVAQEVRALAQRSSDAAKEIKGLITASSQHVETGVELVGKAGSALEKIVGRVESINGLVSDIAVSAKEQADSLSEANTAVNNMDQVTQQNASMVEETTAASRTLSGDANELMRQVAHFKIGSDGASGASTSAGHGAPRNSGGQSVVDQQRRAASFASNGSAALQASFEDKSEEWEDF